MRLVEPAAPCSSTKDGQNKKWKGGHDDPLAKRKIAKRRHVRRRVTQTIIKPYENGLVSKIQGSERHSRERCVEGHQC